MHNRRSLQGCLAETRPKGGREAPGAQRLRWHLLQRLLQVNASDIHTFGICNGLNGSPLKTGPETSECGHIWKKGSLKM